ncbi:MULTISPECIES: TonB-dependent hemoglobin/transferrin/lactoferrin family receptor [unclassified Rubrivivax]|uniref:TonB-dependent hemoglobin/transferrin/lactoferrin family receptor n=1 Tax=unclassified Rubrivivax TaxID=2649762 RepID=UPI001E38AC12|nr:MULTISPECIES: TonB-dependent hemoglobin/transferrin/lactoferrin family receptor [unclassified Rubrivivax]MCC9598413.1 TonB-dependent hemoglobin/transferrin/lactoferrin family receptor [Rubrivivax sp. JA1055]MCC9648113.1 TonB-dependent hemoglobin/transferrin/lactoferrin family receptor [Rubrivivax sp. JA1029]
MSQPQGSRRARRFVLQPLSLAAAALAASLAQAQTAPRGELLAQAPLPKVVVSATRVEANEDEVAATASAVTAEEIDRRGANDIQDLLKQEAGVAVRSLPNRSSAAFYNTGRGGNEGINIRGLEGNQVMLQVDGVRLPMLYSNGPFFAGRGDYIDVEAFKRVELLRGPSSASYGSDGLAGAVSFVTKDPSDLLRDGETHAESLKLGYRSVDDSWVAVPTFALRTEGGTEAMLLASLRRGHEVDNRGDNDAKNNTRTTANPQDTRSNFLLAKLEQRLDARQKLKFSAEHMSRRLDSEIYTLFGDPMYPTTTDVEAAERIQRTLLKAGYEFSDPRAAWFQRASGTLYLQDSENRQLGYEARSNTTNWNSRDRDTRYGEKTVGGSLQFESNFGTEVAQRIVWGLDASTTEVTTISKGGNHLNGVPSTQTPFVEKKNFPDTDYRLIGAFVQDEISLGRLALIPALRWDHFKLDPERNDPLASANNASTPVALSGSEFSPRLGLVWKFSPALRAVANLAHGFRAPTPSQVNGGVTNLNASTPYMSIGNPDLKPETSDTAEFGLRGESGALRWTATVFKSRYKNFIEAGVEVGGAGTVLDPLILQAVNLNRVDIRGVEATLDWAVHPGWTLSARYAHAHGDSREGGVEQALESVEPDKLVLAVKREVGHFGTEFAVTAMKRQGRYVPVDSAGTQYVPGGFAVADLSMWWLVRPDTELVFGVTNLFDKKYIQWADARELTTTTRAVDAFTQPGRNVNASVRYRF